MRVEALNTGVLGVNTYVVFNDELKECFVVDAGGDYPKIKNLIDKNGANCKAILVTHGHFDHIGAVAEFQDAGVKVYCHKADEMFTLKPSSTGYPSLAKLIKPFKADVNVNDGDVLTLAGLEIMVIHTPGHSAGGVCYRIMDTLFSGDTLFHHSIGRTDLPTGNYGELINSIKTKLMNLPNLKVLPGHDSSTTIDEERNFNPFLNEEI